MKIPLLKKKPYCLAPFTAAVVDPNKGVRPCCTFDGQLGNLQIDSLADIIASDEWTSIQKGMIDGPVPDGCLNCYEREKATGWSVRTSFFETRAAAKDGRWRLGLTELEINSTNVCNLTCTHCSNDFSSGWGRVVTQLEESHVPHYREVGQRVFPPDPGNIVRQVAALDLTHLDRICFKGGEPMLNADVPALLRFFRDRGLLGRLSLVFISNGSVLNEEVRELVARARRVTMCISVDGIGKVQEYIRRGPSGIERIESFIEKLSSLKNIDFRLSISVMVYNVFSLDRIADWWTGIHERYPDKTPKMLRFPLHVTQPVILSVSVLQDPTRKRLIERYRSLGAADYSNVIHALRQPFAGARIHNDFIEYTRGMDRIWDSDILKVVPELEGEMVPLEVPDAPARRSRWTLFRAKAKEGSASGPQSVWATLLARWRARAADRALRKGISLSQAGRYHAAIGLYDRYLETHGEESLSRSWQIRLHRAVLLGKAKEWDESVAEFYGLVRANPEATLSAVRETEASKAGPVLPSLSDRLWEETGFAQTSFRLFVEGLAYRALDDEAAAAVRFEKALELSPGFTLARVARRETQMEI